MEWWVLELITVTVMVAVIGVLGPLIKRYGKSYAADVFRVNPRTGKRYLVLMDFAYYLIFGAYILFSIKWEPDTGVRLGPGGASAHRGCVHRSGRSYSACRSCRHAQGPP